MIKPIPDIHNPMRRLVLFSFLAAALLGGSFFLPLWQVTLSAHQYPNGLQLKVYGRGVEGDVREVNIINHYIGMQKIDPKPARETMLFPLGIAILIALALLAPLHRRLLYAALSATAAAPVAILIIVQSWLYFYGNNLDPTAPLRQPPFTPLVLGVSRIGNFTSTASVGTGFLCIVGASLLLAAGLWLSRRPERGRIRYGVLVAGNVLLVMMALPVSLWSAPEPTLQEKISGLEPGAALEVRGGIHHGPFVVRGPVTLTGVGWPILDGGGAGSVVTIEGDGVRLRGFVIRNSGREVTEEAAGIKLRGNNHRIENNRIHDVYFGIHASAGERILLSGNEIVPGVDYGARPGHGISVWNVRNSQLTGNRISQARDGIYLSFTQGIEVDHNQITGCRYAIHSMYSQQAAIIANVISRNLLGAALMYSNQLTLRQNRIEHHRLGATAYGVLLKDIGNLVLEGNTVLANRVGIYADAVALQGEEEAQVRHNLLLGNETALGLQSNARLTVFGNRMIDNLADVRTEGVRLSAANRWSHQGRGNFWSQYRGYDHNGDGIGDHPFRLAGVMNDLLQRAPLARAFLYTPAHLALEAAFRMFPLYRAEPILVDEFPLMHSGSAFSAGEEGK